MSETPLTDAIVDTAVMLAAQSDWESLRLYQVAEKLGISLNDIRSQFNEKDAIVDAWFDRADQAMLDACDQTGFSEMSARQKIVHCLMAWFEALGKQQQVTRQMIAAKLEFGHVHIQFPAIMRISRTVQWLREAAQRNAPLPRRALEETALTSIYIATFGFWLNDRSHQYQATRQLLDFKLSIAERFSRCLFRDSKTD